jgi:hypothetical protein
MSEPYWSALGGYGVDYEGVWSAAKVYAPGDVVRHNGVDYLAVNPSTGVNPGVASGIAPSVGFGTTLPGSPVDGQEFVLVDSLTAPTYSWRLRYIAAKASNKWVFVGGVPGFANVNTAENVSSGAYHDLATVGPAFALPVVGDYIVGHGCLVGNYGGDTSYMSYAIGATAASDADACQHLSVTANTGASISRKQLKTGLAAVTLTAKYKNPAGSSRSFAHRWLEVTPKAIGG